MAPLLYVTLEGLLRWLLEKIILKVLLKLILEENCLNQRIPTFKNRSSDIRSATKLQIAEYKKKVTYKESKSIHFS